MRLTRPGYPRPGPGTLLSALVAAGLFWVAYDNGSYSLASRSTLAIAVWWGFIVAIAFGLWPRTPVPRAAMLVGGLIAALALWIFASLLRTPNAEATFEEFNRASLYLGTFIVVALVSRRTNLGRFADGLAMAVTGVAAVALISRLFPGSFPEGDLPTFLPGTVTRLSFPLGYWNGLAIFLALGIPLLLRLSLVARSGLVRGLALTPMPVITAAVYLTSSRGGVATALAGSLVLVVLTERRWAVAAALAASLVGAAVAIGVLLARDELVNGPLGTELVERQGRSAALLIALACLCTGGLYALGVHLLEGVRRPGRSTGRTVVVTALVLAAVGIIVSDPAARIRGFKALPGADITSSEGGFVKAHLLSGGGSGRWQFWSAALDQWDAHRMLGVWSGDIRELVGAARLVLVLRPGRPLALPGNPRRAGHRRLPVDRRSGRLRHRGRGTAVMADARRSGSHDRGSHGRLRRVHGEPWFRVDVGADRGERARNRHARARHRACDCSTRRAPDRRRRHADDAAPEGRLRARDRSPGRRLAPDLRAGDSRACQPGGRPESGRCPKIRPRDAP